MNKDTSLPAFPATESHGLNNGLPGMTIRPWYAGLAMQSILQTWNEFPDETWRTGLATDAFAMADAVIAWGSK